VTANAQVPVLLLTGFLGAGKTTAINHILSAPHGRRLAAVVNDFGAINIDAELIEGASDGVFSLRNGCICCSLQGDLLRTLSTILRREPPPDGIVIEASGVSDPTEIVRNLLDPVIWQAAALDAVVALVDARQALDDPRITADALCRAQIAAADFIALNKVDLLTDSEQPEARARVAAVAPRAHIVSCAFGRIPSEILFGATLHQATSRSARTADFAPPPFETLSWSCDVPLSLPRFQAAVGTLAPQLVRAKGILEFREQPGRPMLFQLAGRRATLGAAPPARDSHAPVRLVLIAESGRIDAASVRRMLAACEAAA
jgi:cobalamin biosynthesis protein CobW